MKVVSLFTGAGGLDLGLHQAGHEIILQCECDPGAQQVLRKAFPGVLLVPDICGLQSLPKETELVAAGFPCIDVSRAGLRQGLDGPSTGLVRHVFRLLDQARRDQRPVPWVLLENVEALLDRCHGGPPLVAWVVQQLEQLGYRSWAHRVICSAGFGVPNRRKRIFILASMHGDARDVLLGQVRGAGTGKAACTLAYMGLQRCMGACLGATGGDCWECFDPDDDPETGNKSAAAIMRCSYALDLGNARSAAGVDVVPTFTTSNARICLLLSNGKYGALRIEDAERLQGLPVGHTAACYPVQAPGLKQHRGAALRDTEADTQARARFALLGNAVTVQVARWLGERLADPYKYKYMVTDNDMPLTKTYQPPGISDSVWQSLREIRLDAIEGGGAAGGHAKLVSRGQTAWEATALAGEPNNSSGSSSDSSEDERDEDEAAAAAEAEQDDDSRDECDKDSPTDRNAAAAAVATPVGVSNGGGSSGGMGAAANGRGPGAAAAAGGGGGESDEDTEPAPADTAQPAAGTANGKVVRERYRTGGLSTSWPKAAWFMAGHGRWGLKEASDSPVKVRFNPLGEFIRRVGPAPPDVALVTYLQRLKEQGWNVDRTERKMLMCGVAGLSTGGAAAAADGLKDLLADVLNPSSTDTNTAADSIGSLVWAQLWTADDKSGRTSAATGVYWPCEAIDPFQPPRGFKLLPEHKLALSNDPAERRKYLPPDGGSSGRVDDSIASAGTSAAAAASTPSSTQPHPVADSSAGSAAGTSGPAAAAAAVKDPKRKLLLVWFHTNQYEWRFEDELLPFTEHKARFKAEAASLLEAGKLSRPQEWRRAYREAKHCATILARAAKLRVKAAALAPIAGPAAAQLAAAELSSESNSSDSDEEQGEDKGHRAAVAGRAAKQALAVNLRMPRCKVCEACTQSTGSSSRRCLLVRATAAAASGHAGAQLSVLGDKAVGAEIEVWWPLDQAWYKGVITSYDNLRVRHTISYEDGDVEIIPLWAPQQRIKLRSQPAQWVAKAAELARARDAAKRAMDEARLRVAGAGGLPVAPSLTALEQERADNIARNKEALQRYMDLNTVPSDLPSSTPPVQPGTADPSALAAAAAAFPPSTPGAVSSTPKAAAAAAEAGGGSSSSRAGKAHGAARAKACRRPRGRPTGKPNKPGQTATAAVAAGDKVGDKDPADGSGSMHVTAVPAVLDGSTAVDVSVRQEQQPEAAAAAVQPADSVGQAAPYPSSRGIKRTAAAVADLKMKDQLHAIAAAPTQLSKKRKPATATKALAAAATAAAAGQQDGLAVTDSENVLPLVSTPAK